MVRLQQQNYKTQTARYNSWAAVQHCTVPTVQMEIHRILLLLLLEGECTSACDMSLCEMWLYQHAPSAVTQQSLRLGAVRVEFFQGILK